MKLLITGGCGFLGSNLAAFFLEKQCDVVIIDAQFRAGSEQNLAWLKNLARPRQLTFYKYDIADQDAVDSVFKQHAPFDYICHVAGQVAMTVSLSDPRRDMKTNVMGTFNVLEATRRYSPEALIAYSSTNKVYGDLGHLKYLELAMRYSVPDYPNGFDESLPLDFSTPYGCSKGGADQYVRDWCRVYGIKTVVFRHSSIYGGRQFPTFDQGWIGWFCKCAIEQQNSKASNSVIKPFTISGTGKQVRDVLFADDLVHLYNAAFMGKEIVAGQIYNIGGGLENSLSLLELFRVLQDILRLQEPLEYISTPRRQSDQDVFVADIKKAKSHMEWAPLTSAQQGIRKMINWLTS